ncbi:MAG TPA: SIS domain-containing protein [Polyangiaceae bacterium]|nr:SIS domain-containing protein [Polyangiaceae bacterium]
MRAVMCGVIGLIFERTRKDLGLVAAELLQTLEYRGYDSTGAAVQGDAPDDVRLVKGVGAPSVMVHKLGIVKMEGRVFCGQVRWATFGAVTDANSQPHVVRCKAHLYGAHNGNVTNCDDLKAWLTAEGHQVASDNDGEMVVHTIEHFFALELASAPQAQRERSDVRRACMRAAIVRGCARLKGSFAAVVVDPVSACVWAIKQGSSLYFGFGTDDAGGSFRIASSDLSSVLRLTRVLVPMHEGEFAEYDATGHCLYAIPAADGRSTVLPGATSLHREPVRSRLRAKDTGLVPPFETFMDQEISAQQETCRNVVSVFLGGSPLARSVAPALAACDSLPELERQVQAMLDACDDATIGRGFHTVADLPACRALIDGLPEELRVRRLLEPSADLADRLVSQEAGFLADLVPMARGPHDLAVIRLVDAMLELEELRSFSNAVDGFVQTAMACLRRSGRIYVVCCGSSFHAAKAACLFFNELACTELIPILPGEFRGQYSRSLRDGDLFVAVSQSGETKDLIDVLNSIIASGKDIQRVSLVNNVNSTLAQEKSHLVIPLRCGPEVAVPATKSFINQVTLFYCLALRLGERRLEATEQGAAGGWNAEPEEIARLRAELYTRRQKLLDLPLLIGETVASTDASVERAAQMLYLAPSTHVLATRITAVAKEGALKIREVVLNHTEGFEGSEFKHGPNTILGFNTLFGPLALDSLLRRLGKTVETIASEGIARPLAPDAVPRLVQAAVDAVFHPTPRPFSLAADEQAVFDQLVDRADLLSALRSDYPLIYVTGPDEQDVHLTVSQINTHKIRGASTVVVAEDHPALHQAASKPPADNPGYQSVYITLPRTNDTMMTVFSATVVLQRLALKMSLLKAQYLDRLGIHDHGVHPDVPKNVSKSITVD